MSKSSDDVSTFQMIVDGHDDTEPGEPSRHLIENLDENLQRAIKAVEDTGKPATVTLKIKIARDGATRVQFFPSVKAEIPNPPLSSFALWTKGNGRLSRTNPHQKALDFKPVRAVPGDEGKN